MLINTVVLFLRDLLPVFLLVAILWAYFPQQHLERLIACNLLLGSTLAILLTQSSHLITQMFDGRGLEILYSLGHLVSYFTILIILLSNRYRRLTYSVIIVVNQMLYGASFIIFINAFWDQVGGFYSMSVGVILGVGICLSVAILLFFLLRIPQLIRYYLPIITMLAFATSQLISAFNLLVQIDCLPTSSILWNSNMLIEQQSVIGQFLTALIGYDATPTTLGMMIYLCAFLCPLLIRLKITPKNSGQGIAPC